MHAPFMPGLELSRRFYVDAVRPLLDEEFPRLAYAAVRLGQGSDVLGLDTERSTDHDWGPRLQLLLSPADAGAADAITVMLSHRLPKEIAGWPTHFAGPPGVSTTPMWTDGPVAHRVDVVEVGAWLVGQLGFDPRAGVRTADWLATPTQLLAETVAGAVFHDGPGEISRARDALAWYPDDVWRYVLACGWTRIAQEEPCGGRPGERGDDMGSRVVAARLARDVMRQCLLLTRRYPLYSKWLGTAFARLAATDATAALVRDGLAHALAAPDWREREAGLCAAYEAAATLQNATGLASAVDTAVRPFHDRPFRVLDAARFASALRAAIGDEVIHALPVTGAIDQFTDSTDVTCHPSRARALQRALAEF